jgi:hypothetical protein
MAPAVIDQYKPLVDHFVDAIKSDFRVIEAIASRATSIQAARGPKQLAGSALTGE